MVVIKTKAALAVKNIHAFFNRIDASMWLVWALCITVSVTIMGEALGCVRDLKGYIIVIAQDLAFLTLPFWLLPRRLKYWTVIFLWLMCLMFVANTLYFKYWHDMLSLSQMFVKENFNSFVFGSIGPLWGWPETSIVLIASAYTATYIFYFRHRRHSMGWKPRLLIFLISFIVGFGCVLATVARNTIWYRKGASFDISYSDVFKKYFGVYGSNVSYFELGGFSRYSLAQAMDMLQPRHIGLDEVQKAEVEDYLNRDNRSVFEPLDSMPDFSVNREKNLIFIIVESLNSNVVGKKINGRSVTPVLDSLISSPGTFYCLDMITQIRAGGSSDGQMMYNAGLLPVVSGSAILKFADNSNFRGLPEVLDLASSAEFICESSTVWRHRESSSAFGYGKVYDMDSILSAGLEPEKIGDDRAVFTYALDRLKDMQHPFMAEITTLSMHYPYLQKGFDFTDELHGEGESESEANYNSATHFFDLWLGRFIEGLKKKGLYDTSVIVIASDHEYAVDPAKADHSDDHELYSPIVFMVLNGGTEGKYAYPMGQIDVYPSVIDLMGGDSRGKGLGHSIFRYKVTGSVDARGNVRGQLTPLAEKTLLRAWDVSDLIIRSDYPYAR